MANIKSDKDVLVELSEDVKDSAKTSKKQVKQSIKKQSSKSNSLKASALGVLKGFDFENGKASDVLSELVSCVDDKECLFIDNNKYKEGSGKGAFKQVVVRELASKWRVPNSSKFKLISVKYTSKTDLVHQVIVSVEPSADNEFIVLVDSGGHRGNVLNALQAISSLQIRKTAHCDALFANDNVMIAVLSKK